MDQSFDQQEVVVTPNVRQEAAASTSTAQSPNGSCAASSGATVNAQAAASAPQMTPASPSKQPKQIQQVIDTLQLQGMELSELATIIFAREQQITTWLSVLPADELLRYLAICAVFLATRVEDATKLDQLSISMSQGVKLSNLLASSSLNCRLAEFFEVLNACVVTLLLEGSDIHQALRRAQKKLLAQSCLFEEYLATFERFFSTDALSVLDSHMQDDIVLSNISNSSNLGLLHDQLFRAGWLLYLVSKRQYNDQTVDFETLAHLFVSTLYFVWSKSPLRLQGTTEEEVFAAFGVNKSDLSQSVLQLPATVLSSIISSVSAADALSSNLLAATCSALEQRLAQTSPEHGALDFDDRMFLDHHDLLGDISKLKSGPVYSMNGIKDKSSQSIVFASPLRSPRASSAATQPNGTPVNLLLSTLRSISLLRNHLKDESAEPSAKLQPYLTEDLRTLVQDRVNTAAASIAQQFTTELDAERVSIRRDAVKKLYYEALFNILKAEESRLHTKDHSALLKNDKFNRSLLACCAQTVLFSYNSRDVMSINTLFSALNLHAFDVFKLIETYVLHSQWLSSPVKRHYRALEEHIMDSLAWSTGSPMLELLRKDAAATAAATSSSSMPAPPSANAPPTPLSKRTGRAPDMFLSPARPSASSASSQESTSSQPSSSSSVPRSLDFFFRKVYRLMAARTTELFSYFMDQSDTDMKSKMDRVWTIACKVLDSAETRELLVGRHIDHIIMCSMYAICSKVHGLNISFKNIIASYKQICESSSSQISPVDIGKVLMQVPMSNVQGHATYGDIVKFYNKVFIPATKDLILNSSQENDYKIPTSIEGLQSPPRRRVTQNANVFVSPRRQNPGAAQSLSTPFLDSAPVTPGRGTPSSAAAAAPSMPQVISASQMTPKTRALYSFGDHRAARVGGMPASPAVASSIPLPSASPVVTAPKQGLSPAIQGLAAAQVQSSSQDKKSAKRSLFSFDEDDDDEDDEESQDESADKVKQPEKKVPKL